MKSYVKWIVPIAALIVVLLIVISRRPVEDEFVAPIAEGPTEPVVAPEPVVTPEPVTVEEIDPPVTVEAPDRPTPPAPEAWPPVEDDVPETVAEDDESPAVTDPDLPTRPEFLASTDEELQASPKDERVRQLAMQIQVGSGPEAIEEARQLLATGDAELGLVAAAILADQPEWDLALLEAVEDHASVGVPLYAWQGLRDAGRYNDAAALEATLARRLAGMDNLGDWASGAGLPGTAARGLIDFAASRLDGAGYAEVLEGLVLDDNGDYAGRMRALLAHEDTLEFPDYRDRVYQELERSQDGGDLVWNAGLERLAERLEGPVEVHTDTRIIVPQDVDLMLAREYPAMFEDLALMLERSLERGNAIYAEGLDSRLELLLEESQRRPLSAGDRNALQRIESLRGQLQEQDISHLPPPVPPIDAD